MREPPNPRSIRPSDASAGGARLAEGGQPSPDPDPTYSHEQAIRALGEQIQSMTKRTLDALWTVAEQMGAHIEALDKRAGNLEISMARIRTTVEAIEADIRRLLDVPEPRSPEQPAAEPVPHAPEKTPEHIERMIDRIWEEEPGPVEEGLGRGEGG